MKWAHFNFDPAKERIGKKERLIQQLPIYRTFISYFECPEPFSQGKDKLDVNHSIICYGGVPESAMESHCTITHGLSDPTWEWCVLPRESWAGSSTGK